MLRIQTAKQEFYDRFKFPSCVGAIDCTHVQIEKPAGAIGNEYVNRKGYASINVQATCDADYRFTSVDASWPGSVHDNRIFKNSDIYADLTTQTGVVLLGDEGYGIAPFLMKPFRDATSPEETHFNRVHSRARIVIENAFGQLKRRFPIIKYMIRVKLDRVPTFVVACVVLHNIARELGDTTLDDETSTNEEMDEVNVLPGEDSDAGDVQRRAAGVQRRLDIAEILYRRRNEYNRIL